MSICGTHGGAPSVPAITRSSDRPRRARDRRPRPPPPRAHARPPRGPRDDRLPPGSPWRARSGRVRCHDRARREPSTSSASGHSGFSRTASSSALVPRSSPIPIRETASPYQVSAEAGSPATTRRHSSIDSASRRRPRRQWARFRRVQELGREGEGMIAFRQRDGGPPAPVEDEAEGVGLVALSGGVRRSGPPTRKDRRPAR